MQRNSSIQRHWDQWNNDVINLSQAQGQDAVSITSKIMSSFLVDRWLNNQCKRAVQFGAATGGYLRQLNKKGFEVAGYDFSEVALSYLKEKIPSISVRKIDLNQLDDEMGLSYIEDLNRDLEAETNIFLMMILEYLDETARIALIHQLIELAKPGTCFFIANHVYQDSEEINEKYKDNIKLLKRNYLPSFFSPRTDIEFLYHSNQKYDDSPLGRELEKSREIIVLRKIKS